MRRRVEEYDEPVSPNEGAAGSGVTKCDEPGSPNEGQAAVINRVCQRRRLVQEPNDGAHVSNVINRQR